jgi:isopentenyldiphosphate isomerase
MVIDVVDDADHVVGTIRRDEALTSSVGFRVAHVFIFNRRGHLLLQRLAPERERHPLRWGSSVAGYLFSGESYEEAARRRVQQELGIDALALAPVGVTSMHDTAARKFIGLFTASHDGPFTPLSSQIAELRFWPLREIELGLVTAPETFTPTFAHLFRFYRSRTG